MIGFETIGNATVTVFDDEPILTTDPWIYGAISLITNHVLNFDVRGFQNVG